MASAAGEFVDGWVPPATMGKMRAAMAKSKSKTARTKRVGDAEAIKALPGYASGTLTDDQVAVIWGTPHLEEYVRNFFGQFGYRMYA